MSKHVLQTIQCADSRRIVERALNAGWEWVGFTKGGHGQLRWPATGVVIPFAATPSDKRYAWRNLARRIKAESGLDFTQNGNRRRSRKNPNVPDPQVEAARRRHQRQIAARQAAEQQQRAEREAARIRQQAAACRAADEDRRRREIESLMRPGWGR